MKNYAWFSALMWFVKFWLDSIWRQLNLIQSRGDLSRGFLCPGGNGSDHSGKSFLLRVKMRIRFSPICLSSRMIARVKWSLLGRIMNEIYRKFTSKSPNILWRLRDINNFSRISKDVMSLSVPRHSPSPPHTPPPPGSPSLLSRPLPSS